MVPRGARVARPDRPSGSASGSGPGAGETASCRRTAGSRSSAAPAWTRPTTTAPGEWYLHLFAPEQPDLNWTHPDVWVEHEDVLRFWFDRGVAGVRIDSAALLVKDPELAEEPPTARPGEHPFTDRDELHEIYRRWRAIADSYDEPRVLVGEVWLPDAERLRALPAARRAAHRVQLRLPRVPVGAGPRCARRSTSALAAHAPVDAPATWVLSNHDVTRPVTRYGRADTSFAFESKRAGTPTDLAARHAARASRGAARDGAARLDVRLPGRGARPARGRGHPVRAPPGSDVAALGRRRSWPRRLPGPAALGGRPAAVRLQPRRRRPTVARPARRLGAAHGRGAVASRDVDARALPRRPAPPPSDAVGGRRRLCAGSRRPSAVLAFARGDRFVCIVNFGPEPVELPAGASVLIASNELEGGALPQDTTVWLRQAKVSSVRTVDRITAMAAASDHGATKGRTMKSTRRATMRRRHRGEPAGRVRELDLERSRELRRRHGHDQRRIADPGQHARGDPAVQQPGRGVREGESRRSTSSRSSTSGPAPTFAAKLAAGTLPTVFEVPFTDARTLGDNGQLADLTG